MKVNQASFVSTSHTVRLVPSTAMNPFGTIYLIRSCGALTYTGGRKPDTPKGVDGRAKTSNMSFSVSREISGDEEGAGGRRRYGSGQGLAGKGSTGVRVLEAREAGTPSFTHEALNVMSTHAPINNKKSRPR